MTPELRVTASLFKVHSSIHLAIQEGNSELNLGRCKTVQTQYDKSLVLSSSSVRKMSGCGPNELPQMHVKPRNYLSHLIIGD